MQGASLAELRDLSRRSRRAQRHGLLAILLVLASLPAQLLLAPRIGLPWAAALVLVVGGLSFVAYAHAAGEERGAFRRVFRRLAEEKKRARTLVPTAARAPEEEATVLS